MGFEWYDYREVSIYVLYDNEKNCYVGQTLNTSRRYKQHLACARRYKNRTDNKKYSDLERTTLWIASKPDCHVEIIVVDNIFSNLYKIRQLERIWRCIATLNGYNVIDVDNPMNTDMETLERAERRKSEWTLK